MATKLYLNPDDPLEKIQQQLKQVLDTDVDVVARVMHEPEQIKWLFATILDNRRMVLELIERVRRLET